MTADGYPVAPAQPSEGVLAGIGSTPLIELRKVVPRSGARNLVKLESANRGQITEDLIKRMIARAARALDPRRRGRAPGAIARRPGRGG
jgi:hypothetical protein